MTHPTWCDRTRCQDRDGTLWHAQALSEIPVIDGALTVAVVRIDGPEPETWIDLRFGVNSGVAMTPDQARLLRDMLDDRIRLAGGKQR